MRGYHRPTLEHLGSMAAVTRKSGVDYDLEIFDFASAGNPPPICDLYPWLWFCP